MQEINNEREKKKGGGGVPWVDNKETGSSTLQPQTCLQINEDDWRGLSSLPARGSIHPICSPGDQRQQITQPFIQGISMQQGILPVRHAVSYGVRTRH